MFVINSTQRSLNYSSCRSLASCLARSELWPYPECSSSSRKINYKAFQTSSLLPTIHFTGYSSSGQDQQIRTLLSSSSFSALPPDEEENEKARVASLTPYQKEMELRRLDSEIARLQTLRGINTGELYTLRGKMKFLARDYGIGFMVWYWTVWFTTAGLTYAAMEVGGVDPVIVAGKVEAFLGWDAGALSGRLDPTLGKLGLTIAVNECLEPLRLPIVVLTTKPVVNLFSKRSY